MSQSWSEFGATVPLSVAMEEAFCFCCYPWLVDFARGHFSGDVTVEDLEQASFDLGPHGIYTVRWTVFAKEVGGSESMGATFQAIDVSLFPKSDLAFDGLFSG